MTKSMKSSASHDAHDAGTGSMVRSNVRSALFFPTSKRKKGSPNGST